LGRLDRLVLRFRDCGFEFSHHVAFFSTAGGTSSRSSSPPDSAPTFAPFHSSRYVLGLKMPSPGWNLSRAW